RTLQQDPALLLTPTMPPPESPSEGHESSRSALPRAEARLLALHNVSFLELLTTYRSNPQEGLKKYGHYLSLQTTSSSSAAQLAQYLQALSTYLQGLLEGNSLTGAEGSSTLSGQRLAKKASQQR
uniref:Promyelocytic leukemia n=1 Tax=Nannospalax galili TaxID=1026970 RepID=A0A8C6QJA9_NANGA